MIRLIVPPRKMELSTTHGTEVPNEVGPPFLNKERDRLDRAMNAKYCSLEHSPPAIQWTRANSRYNCYGMVIGNRWTHVEEWVVDSVLTDEYTQIQEEEVVPGDIIVYRNRNGGINHLGVVSRFRSLQGEEVPRPDLGAIQIIVLSKWGSAGEYEHVVHHCPDGGSNIEFWRLHDKENVRGTS